MSEREGGQEKRGEQHHDNVNFVVPKHNVYTIKVSSERSKHEYQNFDMRLSIQTCVYVHTYNHY